MVTSLPKGLTCDSVIHEGGGAQPYDRPDGTWSISSDEFTPVVLGMVVSILQEQDNRLDVGRVGVCLCPPPYQTCN